MGFGLDLSACAATGNSDQLVYVSPKSGKAVSKAAGKPYHQKLLPLPGFLTSDHKTANSPSTADLASGLEMAEYFELDEIVILTWTHNQEDRRRSYKLLANAFNL